MDADFWHERWLARELGFHEGRPNALLVRFLDVLALDADARIFVPLCGKTIDIHWLLARGHRVVGVELSRTAVEELFAELDCEPAITRRGAHECFTARDIEVYVGDFFDLTAAQLGRIDAVYDRAALVALPEQMRRRYAVHLSQITNVARQLLICFEYDQQAMDGPPFSVPGNALKSLYGTHYELRRLAEVEFPGGLKGNCPALECAWQLQPKVAGPQGE